MALDAGRGNGRRLRNGPVEAERFTGSVVAL